MIIEGEPFPVADWSAWPARRAAREGGHALHRGRAASGATPFIVD
jgi:hypothetical protein